MTGRLLRPAERGDCSSVVDTVQRANTAAQRRQTPNAAARRRLRHEAAGGRAAARALADRGREPDQRRGDRRRLADVRADRNDAGAERGFNRRSCGYFSDVLTATNLVLRTVPMPLTVVTITMLMPAAIIQYSIAVAPVSSLRNFEMSCRIKTPVGASHRVFSRTVGRI